jgi:uncharacterized protein YndB with AHSA1/START domain
MTATVTVTRRYDAAPERVFDAWLDPKLAGRFLFATPDGQMVRADIDARAGGRFNFTDRRAEHGDVEHLGEYLEIDRPRRLVFTFAVPQYDPTPTTVAIDIRPAGEGSELTLTHTGVLPDWTEQTRQGWGMILDSLERVLT